MKHAYSSHVLRGFVVVGLVGLAGPSALQAQRGGGYDLSFSTVDGGGGTSSSLDGRFSLSGTIGQPDAGTLGQGQFALRGGFWGGSGVSVAAFSLVGGVCLGLLLSRRSIGRLRNRRPSTDPEQALEL